MRNRCLTVWWELLSHTALFVETAWWAHSSQDFDRFMGHLHYIKCSFKVWQKYAKHPSPFGRKTYFLLTQKRRGFRYLAGTMVGSWFLPLKQSVFGSFSESRSCNTFTSNFQRHTHLKSNFSINFVVVYMSRCRASGPASYRCTANSTWHKSSRWTSSTTSSTKWNSYRSCLTSRAAPQFEAGRATRYAIIYS